MKIDKKIKIKIAKYYYQEEYTQTRIAKKLSIPRQTINKIVNNLVDEGIVRIEINDEGFFTDLENDLEKKFDLKQAIVTDYVDQDDMVNSLGKKGSEYLMRIINKDTKLGISWGKTLAAFASALPQTDFNGVSVVQLVGGTNSLANSVKADEITRLIANKFNGKSYLLYAPSHVKNKETKEMFLEEDNIKNVFQNMQECDVAIVGIGQLSKEATIFKENYLQEADFHDLAATGCVGDICSRYYDKDGYIVSHRINDTTIGIDIETLRGIPTVVGIAGGIKKFEAILAALQGDFLDVLITTKDVAEKLVGQQGV